MQLAGIADSFGEQTETLGRRFTGTNSGLHALGQELIYGLYALYFLFPDVNNSLFDNFVMDKRAKIQLRFQEAGSRYFCESLFWASQPKQAAKT
jgi:hypothetical protein